MTARTRVAVYLEPEQLEHLDALRGDLSRQALLRAGIEALYLLGTAATCAVEAEDIAGDMPPRSLASAAPALVEWSGRYVAAARVAEMTTLHAGTALRALWRATGRLR